MLAGAGSGYGESHQAAPLHVAVQGVDAAADTAWCGEDVADDLGGRPAHQQHSGAANERPCQEFYIGLQFYGVCKE